MHFLDILVVFRLDFGQIGFNLAKRHLQHNSYPFLPLALCFTTFCFGMCRNQYFERSLWSGHYWKDAFLLQKFSIDDANNYDVRSGRKAGYGWHGSQWVNDVLVMVNIDTLVCAFAHLQTEIGTRVTVINSFIRNAQDLSALCKTVSLSQNQPATGLTSCRLHRFDHLLPVWKLIGCHLPCDTVHKKVTKYARYLVGKCINYVKNKLDSADKFQQLIKLIIAPSKCIEQQWNEKHFKILPRIGRTSFLPTLTFAWSF